MLLFGVFLAHGRKTFVLNPDERLDPARFRKDLDEVNFLGPRTKFTERVRQLEIEKFIGSVEKAYLSHFAHSVTRIVNGVATFSREVAPRTHSTCSRGRNQQTRDSACSGSRESKTLCQGPTFAFYSRQSWQSFSKNAGFALRLRCNSKNTCACSGRLKTHQRRKPSLEEI